MTPRLPVAGFAGTEYLSAGDSLDHYVNGLAWRLPRDLQVGDTFLRWDRRPKPDVVVRPGPGLLEGFVKLGDAPEDRILAYARKWGPLWLCEHGIHWRQCGPECYPRIDRNAGEWWSWDREYLEHWRALAREARAVVKVARALSNNKLPDVADWRDIPGQGERIQRIFLPLDDHQWVDDLAERTHAYGVEAGDDLEALELLDRELDAEERAREDYLSADEAYRWEREPGAGTVEIHRRLLALVLEKWLWRGGVLPAMYADGDHLSVRLGGYGLLGALAIQLLFDVCRTDGLAVCTSCGTPFLPLRRPRSDRNTYCRDCGRRASVRDAAARYRQARRLGRPGQASGERAGER
jgi:hypothetical protein